VDAGATPGERSRACEQVLDAIAAGRSAVVTGDDGVGLARLLEEVAAGASEDGWTVLPLRATGRDVPLAALDGLLTRSTGTAILEHAIALVAAVRATGDRVVALVDDAALLDAVSAAVLREATVSGVRVVLATRRSERLPDVLRRLDLATVDLGGTARADRRRRRAASRLESLDDLDRRAVEVLAVADGPVGASLVGELLGADVATLVVHGDLVIGDRRERRIDLRLVHHLHAELALETTAEDVLDARRRELADAIAATGARRPDDALRIALLRSAAGDEPAVADVIAAAWELLRAHRDAKLRPADVPESIADALAEAAGHLARQALECGGRTAALEVVVRSLERLDRATEARELVEHVDRYVVDADDEVRAVALQARAAARDGRDQRATATLEGELVDATPEHRARLIAARLDVLVLGGRAREAVADGDELLAAGPLTPRVAAPYGLALAQCGRAADALTHVDPVLALRGVDHDARGLAALTRVAALADLGRIREANDMADLMITVADATDEVGFQAACRLAGSMVAIAAGQPARAAELADGATSRFDTVDFFGLSGGALGVAAVAHAQLGDLVAARARLRAAESTSAQPRAYQHTIAHGRAWWLLAEGHHDRAVHELEEIAMDRRRAGGVSSEVLILHDLVRIGEPARAVARLTSLAVWVQGPLARLAADHANALLQRDSDALDALAARALDLELRLIAADAAAQAAVLHAAHGDAARADRSRRHAEALIAECDGAFTPATAARPTASRRRRGG
jgi:tetratricopeptide (TPR) repeat protein